MHDDMFMGKQDEIPLIPSIKKEREKEREKEKEKGIKKETECISKPYVIGIAGASCSGKSIISKKILEVFADRYGKDDLENIVSVISQDNYYIGGDDTTNYDIPESINFPRLIADLKVLLSGKSVRTPLYDFSCHRPKEETRVIGPSKIIIVEGILIFYIPELRDLIDLKVFVSSYAEIRYERRKTRDIKERGRSTEQVINRYFKDVIPSSLQYVEPTREFCDIVLINNIENKFIGADILLDYIGRNIK